MPTKKHWIYNEIPDETVKKLSSEANISTLLAKVLLNRKVDSVEKINKFINPSLEDLYDPFLMKDMDKAVERVILALENGEKILVYGDYDVDGVTSTAILCNFLAGKKANYDFLIPDRFEEGYGLSINACNVIKKLGAALVITVDCGITAFNEVILLNENGIDVIITDHHECKGELPAAYAVINPNREDCTYPFKKLAGVGVAFKLINAVSIKMKLGDLFFEYLDLVAIGTVADVVSLSDENRIIVKHGLDRIAKTSNRGILSLINVSGLKDKPITSWGIGFVLAPRINAAGRIGDASRAVKLFTTLNESEAEDLATELDEENKLRQETEIGIFNNVLELIERNYNADKEKVIVVAGEGWHHGIIGIVASKITERYYRPCILICLEEGIGKGSGRSIEGFNLFNALDNCGELLEKFGGHSLAAGITIKAENINVFREAINRYADCVIDDSILIPKLKIDTKLDDNDINLTVVSELEMLAPFGAGNPSPVFAYEGFKIGDIRGVGDNKHLKLRLENSGVSVDAIGFNMGNLLSEYKRTDLLDVACALEINTWNSIQKVQLNLKDIRPDTETIFENEYYLSLEKCFNLCQFIENEEIKRTGSRLDELNIIQSEVEFLKEIEKLHNEGIKTIIFANSIVSARNVENILSNSAIGIKKQIIICYTDSINFKSEAIQIVLNPDVETIELKTFEGVVFCGNWISEPYLRSLLNIVDKKKLLFFKPDIGNELNTENIILDRNELLTVYKHLKAYAKGNFIIEDIFLFSKEFSVNYKVCMNYFKMKISIEIFEELGLLSKKSFGKYGLTINIFENKDGRTNLESSVSYRRLQVLKIQR